jgi:hypothetical protein
MVDPDAPNSTSETTPRELDSRINDGIHVHLVWHPRDNHLAVAVQDTKTGEAFEIAVGPGQRALDVFHHPYAYSGSTGESATVTSSAIGLRQTRAASACN